MFTTIRITLDCLLERLLDPLTFPSGRLGITEEDIMHDLEHGDRRASRARPRPSLVETMGGA
jgi:hypothetical protein